MSEKYEVVKTLIRGKQSVRKTETQQGIKVTAHKKPVGYVLRDTKTNETHIVSYYEAIEMVTKHGSTNAQVTVTERKGGKLIPYIRAKAGVENFQSDSMIEEPVDYVKYNPQAKITKEMQTIVEKYMERETSPEKPDDKKAKYTKTEILELIEGLKQKQS